MKNPIKKIFKSKKAEGYVDSGVKILIAVVIGALLLAGVYALFKDNIIQTAQSKVESLFDYGAQPQVNLITFHYGGSEYQAEEGMTWEEWVNSDYNTAGLKVIGIGAIGTSSSVHVSYGKNNWVSKTDTITDGFYYIKAIEMPIISI